MKLLYPEEHISCVNYLKDKSIGFSIQSLKKDEDFVLLDKEMHYIIFLQSGKMRLAFKNVGTKALLGGEMVYIPSNHDGKGFAEADSEFIVLGFDNKHLNLCDEFAIKDLLKYCTVDTDQLSASLPIYPPMQMVLDSVRFYLNNKISCIHLHSIKQKEVFLILRTFYSRSENANLFAPILLPS
ncbi:MAG: hypothetical protein RSC28_02300 [Bacteroidales bacterium]